MLTDIEFVTKSLQTGGLTLAQCRDDLEVLIEIVCLEKTKTGSALYGFKQGPH